MGIRGATWTRFEKIKMVANMHWRNMELLNKCTVIHPNRMNNMGMLEEMYCNSGMECNVAVSSMKKLQMIKSEIGRPNFFIGNKNIKGTNIRGKM